jgi:regulator of protease activity HflC (stomatin/prohibitin superfamily)
MFYEILIVIFVILLLSLLPITVYEGEAIVIERLGKFNRVLYPGIHFIFRIIDSQKKVHWTYQEEQVDNTKNILTRIKADSRIPFNKETIFDPAPTHCTTIDHIRVSPNVVIFYRITDAQKCVYGIKDLYYALQITLSTVLQEGISEMTLDNYIKGKNILLNTLLEKLREANRWGLEIMKVDIQSMGLPKEIISFTEKQAAQEKESEAIKRTDKAKFDQELSLQESRRLLQLLTMQTEKEKIEHQMILEYKTSQTERKIENEKMIQDAESKARSITIIADAEKYRVSTMFKDNLDKQADYHIAKLHTDAWNNLQQNSQKILVVPYEATKFLGSLETLNFVISK